MSKEYETRVTSWTVAPKGEPTFSEMATVVSIDDEAAGEYVVVSQQGRVDLGKIAIDVNEWPALRAAINEAISECRTDDMPADLQSGDRG